MLRDVSLEVSLELVTAFLNTPLYSTKTGGHLPEEAVAVHGNLVSRDASGVQIQATSYRNLRGQDLEGSPATLFIPLHKIDHLSID